MKKKNNTVNINKIIFVVLVLSFCAIILKTSMVALADTTDGINLTEFVNNRNTETETLYAERGSILSSDGEILAHSINSYTVIAYLSDTRTSDKRYPKHVVDKELTAEKLSEIRNRLVHATDDIPDSELQNIVTFVFENTDEIGKLLGVHTSENE